MNTIDELAHAFQKTFDDQNLSRNERKALRAILADVHLDQRKKEILRHKVFEIAELGVASQEFRFILEWAEDASRLIDKLDEEEAREGSGRVYFSPGNECKDAIITQMQNARKTIDICVFTISDNDISDVIEQRHRQGVKVRVITDNDKMYDRGSDVQRLSDAGIEVRTDMTDYHMHHKYALMDGATVLTGSYNWTRSAATKNQENILITSEAGVVREYKRGFAKLWKEMVPYS